jgi:hypothetical protein
MRQVWRLAICFIVGWFLVGAIASVVPQTLESEPTTAPVVQLLNLTKRSSHGSPPLKLAEPLNRAAQLHAEDLATHNFFSHIQCWQSGDSGKLPHCGGKYLSWD